MINEIDCKKLRKQLKLTQMELSAAIGEAESRIWLLEEGFSHLVHPAVVKRIKDKLQDLCERKALEKL